MGKDNLCCPFPHIFVLEALGTQERVWEDMAEPSDEPETDLTDSQ